MKKIFIFIVTMFFILPVIFAQTKAGRTDNTQHPIFNPSSLFGKGTTEGQSPKEQMKAGVTYNYATGIQIAAEKHNDSQCPVCGKKSTLSPKEQMKKEVMKLYTCPMHQDVALNKEGVCPKCAIVLLEQKVQWRLK